MSDGNDSHNDSSSCDDSTYGSYEVVISGLCVPLLITLGLVANVLNILIFGQRQMRRSLVNWYLAFLSVSDVINLSCATFIIALPVISEVVRSATLHDVTSASLLVAYPMGMVMQTASVYLTVCVSAYRYLGVCYPFQSQRFCTARNVRTSIIGVGISALLYNVSRFFEVRMNHCDSLFYNASVLEVVPSAMRMNGDYIQHYHGWVYTTVMLAIPFLLLIAMNICVIIAVHRTRLRHQYEMCGTDDNSNLDAKAKEAAKERSTTIMLIGIVVVFLLCNFLALLSNILEIVKSAVGDEVVGPAFTQIVTLSNLSVTANPLINSLIYFSKSQSQLFVKTRMIKQLCCFKASLTATDCFCTTSSPTLSTEVLTAGCSTRCQAEPDRIWLFTSSSSELLNCSTPVDEKRICRSKSAKRNTRAVAHHHQIPLHSPVGP